MNGCNGCDYLTINGCWTPANSPLCYDYSRHTGRKKEREAAQTCASLLARHNELVEAVAWLVECDYFDRWTTQYHCLVSHEWMRVVYHARSEVDRLIGEVMCAD